MSHLGGHSKVKKHTFIAATEAENPAPQCIVQDPCPMVCINGHSEGTLETTNPTDWGTVVGFLSWLVASN